MHTTRIPVFIIFLTTLSACRLEEANFKHPPKPEVSTPDFEHPVGLAINGFNYTNRVIELFSINNRGGGNIAVSSPTSGGGKTTCCLRWYPGSQFSRPVTIEWMRYKDDKEFWCKKTIMLNAPFPANPTDVGVHFMPDGNIEAEVTEGYPSLKLRLNRFDPGHRNESGNMVYDEKTAECRYGQQ